MRRLLWFVFFFTFIFGACGPKLPPDTSVEAKYSVRGAQVAVALRGSIPAIKSLVCTAEQLTAGMKTCLKPADADVIFKQLDNAGTALVTLGEVLKTVDTTRDSLERSKGLQRAVEIVTAIQQNVSSATIAAEFPEVRAKVMSILNAVTVAMLTLGLVAG